MINFTIGQVVFKVGLGQLSVSAPIAGKAVQLDVHQVYKSRKNKFALRVDGATVVQLEIEVGNGIPF